VTAAAAAMALASGCICFVLASFAALFPVSVFCSCDQLLLLLLH
jgi:hypothetical protein